MTHLLARLFYNSLLMLLALVDVVKWFWFLLTSAIKKLFNNKSDKNNKREWAWGQKYGLVPWSLPYHLLSGNTILVHCASVGEVVGIFPLIKQLMELRPELKFVVTTNTLTGKQTLQRLMSEKDKNKIFHLYFPLDLPWFMSRLIKKLKPKAALIMEVELWPNFIRQCKKRDVPVIVVNARLTDKTARGYKKFSWLCKPMIDSLAMVFVRNNTDKANYQSLGLDKDKLFLLGNVKFDLPLPSLEQAHNKRTALDLNERIVLLAGSTHFGEEELMVKMYTFFKPKFPELLLIMAPRHPQRFTAVLDYLLVQDLKVNQQSKNEGVQEKTDVLLIDEMGLLSELYGVSDIAFVGGSIADKGGHNPIEPASFSVPTLMGPNIYNNPEICEVLSEAGGLKVVNNEEEFQHQLLAWLEDKELREAEGRLGRNTIEDHGGLIASIAEKINMSLS